jgi:hypothetical protein
MEGLLTSVDLLLQLRLPEKFPLLSPLPARTMQLRNVSRY